MENIKKEKPNLLKWIEENHVDTIIVGFPDVYGRLMGKRVTAKYFLDHVVDSGMHACNYLMTVDIDMNPRDGFDLANWEKGFGDFHVQPDMGTLRLAAWNPGTAIVLGDLLHEDDSPVEQAPRQVLARQVDRLLKKGLSASMGSELEFFLVDETYESAREKRYSDLVFASDYSIDYHLLQPARDEDVLGRIRNEMNASDIPVECSKGETGNGQHEVNLVYTTAVEMADRHVVYKLASKDIAAQQGKALTFMAKPAIRFAGNGFHIHTSVWDTVRKENLMWDSKSAGPSRLFYKFLGGLLKYSRELTYFFAPTINSFKRFQPGSWAPTAIVCGLDNRTCGYRIIGSKDSLRIENRMPGADANPYLAFAATLAAGLRGVEEGLEGQVLDKGNAYQDTSSPRLPVTLEQATDLLDNSNMAREAFGADVIDFYVHTARLECEAFAQAVTDWELHRYFEQI